MSRDVWDELQEWHAHTGRGSKLASPLGRGIARGRALEKVAEEARLAWAGWVNQKVDYAARMNRMKDALTELDRASERSLTGRIGHQND